jgi:hypothetical protein
MQINWDAVVQGTTTGLVGAGVLAVLVSGRNRVRNELLRRRIQRKLDRLSVGSGLAGITTSIRNETGRGMVVRQVAFLIGGTYIVLLPAGELTSSYKGETRKPTRAEMRRLKRGEMIEMEAQMQFGSWKVPPDQAGFVALPPYTKSSFILPAQFIANSNDSIQLVRVVLEYETRTGDKKILQHDVKWVDDQHVQKTWTHFHEEITNGNLNKARRMFQMPEVVVKSKTNPAAPVGESPASAP